MFNLKKASLSLATVALAATAGTLLATTAQAAIIGGQVSGTWQYDWDGEGGFKAGDAFTADFTYDSDDITTTDYSDYDDYHRNFDTYLVRSVSLLSLVINSGTISQVFDSVYGYLQWHDVQADPDLYGQYGYEYTYLFARTFSTTDRNYFYARNSLGQYSDGSPFSNSYAVAESYDYSTRTYPIMAYTNSNITFSTPFLDPSEPTASTPEPTSALLTGLLGLGAIALNRRKKIEAAAE